MRDLSRPQTDTIRETHGPGDVSSLCRTCGQPLPCDALDLAEEVDLLRSFEQIQRDERCRLEQRALRYRNVYQRTAVVLFGISIVAGFAAGASYSAGDPVSPLFPAYRVVSNPDEWRLAHWLNG